MPFHRLAVPSYFGGLPGGYDYINNALAGTPSFVNAGTYFIAFGEDATSADANRPSKALAENTDYLDNLLHRDIAVPVRTSDAVGPAAGVLLTGPGIFMGLVGAQLKDLFHVTSDTDEDLEVGGVQIVITGAVDSGGVLLGGGFSLGNVTLTFNLPIPGGQGYHLYYAVRSNFATFPADGLTSTRIRNLTEVDVAVEEMFRLLHGNFEAWNAPWDSTVWDLTARGLDGAYRRSTVGAAGAFNTGGSGAIINRDGRAPTEQSTSIMRLYFDAYQQLHGAEPLEMGSSRTGLPIGSGGYLFRGQRQLLDGGGPPSQPTPSLYSFASIYERKSQILGPAPMVGTGYATQIAANSPATLSQITPQVFQVVLSPGMFFFREFGPNKETAVGLGKDMLLCTDPVVGTVALVIVSLDTTDITGATAHVSPLDGGEVPGLAPVPTAVTVTWVSPRMAMLEGGSATKELFSAMPIGPGEAWDDDMLFVAPLHPALTRDSMDVTGAWNQKFTPTNAYFGALVDYRGGTTLGSALSWGTLQVDVNLPNYGKWRELGKLLADGSVYAQSVQAVGAVTANTMSTSGSLYSGSTITAADMINTTKEILGGYITSYPDEVKLDGAGNPYTVDFTDGSADPFLDAPSTDNVERRFVGPGVAVTINSIKLPVNARIGQRFYLTLSEVDLIGTLTGGLIACINRTGGPPGSDYRVSLFNNYTNTLAGIVGHTRTWEFICVYSGLSTFATHQTTYIVQMYNDYTGLTTAYVD
jgi:hypothetical protein